MPALSNLNADKVDSKKVETVESANSVFYKRPMKASWSKAAVEEG